MSKNGLTSRYFYAIISKFVTTSAAIAQPVERILGKDEVASSNLASSSKKEPRPSGLGSFFAAPDLNHLNAARTSAAAEGSTEANLNFCPSHAGAKMQTNLASSSRKHSLRNSGINRSIRRRRRPPYIIRSLDPLPQCPRPSGLGSFFAAPDLNHLNAARTSAAAEGSTEANLNFCPSHAGAKMQTNLAGSSPILLEGSFVFSIGCRGRSSASPPTFLFIRILVFA